MTKGPRSLAVTSPVRARALDRERPHCWRRALPVLRGQRVMLREVLPSDAAALLKICADPLVRRHMPAVPRTLEEFRQFIAWVRGQRRVGRYICFSSVDVEGRVTGLFQVWPLEPDFGTAEWGFLVARKHWGTGFFTESARILIDFVFRSLAVQRLECRAAAANVRARGALHRLGAIEEGILRECFMGARSRKDFVLHAILARQWMRDARRTSTAGTR